MLSAIIIFINHSGWLNSLGWVDISYGLHGVDFFFVMSGYLIFYSMDRTETYKDFIKRRLIRILPEYYFIVIVALLWNTLIYHGMPHDVLGLGWIRYFLCIQTIVPANDFLWNNIYGLWTISSFVGFYLFAPLARRIINQSVHRAFILQLVCMGWCYVIGKHVVQLENLIPFEVDKMDVLVGSSPLNTLYLFVPGIVAFCIVKSDKIYGVIYLVVSILLGVFIHNDKLIWACSLAIFIVLTEKYDKPKQKHENTGKKTIRKLAALSFPFYLCHMLVLEIVKYYFEDAGKGILISVSIISICIFTILLDALSKILNKKRMVK